MKADKKLTLCLNQSYDGIKESVRIAVLPKIIQALGDKNGRSFVVEFNREATAENGLYGDWAHVAFKTQAPIVFADVTEESK